MKTFHEEIPDLCQDALTDQLFDEHSIFFDIETTGFSPANSTLYMIGCARRKSNRICICLLYTSPAVCEYSANSFW